MQKCKKLIFNLFFIGLVVVFFASLEFILRISGVGIDTRPFFRHPYMSQFYVDNKQFRNKYYNRYVDLSHQPIKNVFSYEKKPGMLRGFVIGGSTAEGFPYYSNHSFSKILEAALREQGKYAGVEVLNMGFSAMSSFYDADVAKKLLKYKPDFIIIYSGHNEYYGTISATTGGSYFTKKLYLFLKESRIFQILFNLFSDLTRSKDSGNRTMMEEQFNNQAIPLDEKFDRKVAEDFINNLDSTVRLYSRQGVHVIVVDPVCNLIDMPPFGSQKNNDPEKEKNLKEFIKSYYNAIIVGNKIELKKAYEERQNHLEYSSNAFILYLDAMAREKLYNEKSLSNYLIAKDFDTVPFRCRSVFNAVISNYSALNEGKNPYYHYIPLQNILQSWFGHRIFGNNIFLDHVHYNWNGNVLIARILAEKIAMVYKYSDEEKKKLISFFSNPEEVKKKLYFTPLHEIFGYYSILMLSQRPPFSTMVIPFIPAPPLNNPFFRDTNIIKMTEEEAFNKIINESIEKKDYDRAFFYINSIMQVYQAEYRNYLALAQFQEMMKSEDAGYNYIVAYLLSGRNREVYSQMENYFLNNGRADMLEMVKKKYGEPRR